MTTPNTVEYAFAQRTTSLASGARHDFPAITVDVAETAGRVFKSVTLEVTCHNNSTANVSPSSVLLGIQIDAVAANDATVSGYQGGAIYHVAFGETKSYLFTRDVTSYFAANFTGASHNVVAAVQLTMSADATINHTAKLIIEYEFDETSAPTRTKTIRIPTDTYQGALTNVLTEISATVQVPQLTGVGGFLKEAGVVPKNIFFTFEGFANNGGIGTDHQTGLSLDAEAEVLDGLHENNLAK